MRKARSGSAAPAAMIGALRFVEADTVYAVYAETIALPMRVRELIEYLATRLGPPSPWDAYRSLTN
jgi:hypothetical protein